MADLLNNEKLKNIVLESAVIHLFVVFFCHRLSDYPSLVPSIDALTALVKIHIKSFNNKYYDILDIFQTILKEINFSNLAQTIRQKLFNLFYEIFSSNIFDGDNNNDNNNKNVTVVTIKSTKLSEKSNKKELNEIQKLNTMYYSGPK